MKKLNHTIAVFLMLINVLAVKSHEAQKKLEIVKFYGDEPRDPKCPCYKYQKRAEKEYQRLLLKEARLSVHSDTTAKKGSLRKRTLLLHHNKRRLAKRRMCYRESRISKCPK